MGVRRGDQTLAYDLARDLVKGFDTPTGQAKSEMRAFMTQQFPDLKASIRLILAEGKIIEGWPIIDESSFFRHLGYQLIPPGKK